MGFKVVGSGGLDSGHLGLRSRLLGLGFIGFRL